MQMVLGCLKEVRPPGLTCQSSAKAVEALQHFGIPQPLWPMGLNLSKRQASAFAYAKSLNPEAECPTSSLASRQTLWRRPHESHCA